MKKSILNSGILLMTILLFISCSSDSSSDNNTSPATENNWKLGNYSFSRTSSVQNTSTYVNGNPFTLVITESNIRNDNNFKACKLTFFFNTHQTGTYTIKSEDALYDNHLLKYLHIECIAVDSAGKTAIYESVDTSISATVTKVENLFVVDVPDQVTLTKTYDGGLENAPGTMTFKCQKVR
ncbi:hypothetical protein G4D82_10110 [Flavobacterium sp. CYK-4]|uniref:hypothetical protein n=1 Tax=Flavobacterium lotistagni TaxID=2709660 RepID=UPI00140A8943|nr:hypothetical protein [Flavobacterium lotistagni]NHM07575.1 hypothetical protein [Flavobacterium lotistagni]